MAVILKISDGTIVPLTVDSTLYTVDSTIITVDQTVILTGSSSNTYSILITPREMVDVVSMEFFNELKETTNTFTASTTNVNGLMQIEFSLIVVEGDSFQLTIKNLVGEVIWKGKAYATEQEDLQNFQFIEKNNNIIKL